MFKALLLEKNEAGFSARVQPVDEALLPAGDVLVQVACSTLNYKDGLAITNRGPVVRQWPMVAGIDGAGVVLESTHPAWKPGDAFVHNGWGVGETHWGCLGERARLKGDWLVKLPAAFNARQAMAIGTAGYTAMLCVMALARHGLKPGDGDVLITGATGGVGSHTLVNACAQTRYGGVVAACGMAQGIDLPGTVLPFILRSITLAGVDSVMAPLALREQAWDRLAQALNPELLDRMTQDITLDDAIKHAQALMEGKVRGRLVVHIR